eukprot:TRINITY_DN31650_c0_g1_i1.p1 TRINITY_DN31650_c0_g1~~TRINITY_DN31650_c0_g1_i1.p1  ORF type:complete len:485 (+),score=85.87 TRINITY_DN31650_c0_g1_i1:61-1515(+)
MAGPRGGSAGRVLLCLAAGGAGAGGGRTPIRVNGHAGGPHGGAPAGLQDAAADDAFPTAPQGEVCGEGDLLLVKFDLGEYYPSVSSAAEGFAGWTVEADDVLEYEVRWLAENANATLDLEGGGWRLRDTDGVSDSNGCPYTAAPCGAWRPQEGWAVRKVPLAPVQGRWISDFSFTAEPGTKQSVRMLVRRAAITRGGKVLRDIWGPSRAHKLLQPRYHWAGTVSAECHAPVEVRGQIGCALGGEEATELPSESAVPATLHGSLRCTAVLTAHSVYAPEPEEPSCAAEGAEMGTCEVAAGAEAAAVAAVVAVAIAVGPAHGQGVAALLNVSLAVSPAAAEESAGAGADDGLLRVLRGALAGTTAECAAGPAAAAAASAGAEQPAADGPAPAASQAVLCLPAGGEAEVEVSVRQLGGPPCAPGCAPADPAMCCVPLAERLYAGSNLTVDVDWAPAGGRQVRTRLLSQPLALACPAPAGAAGRRPLT